MCALLCTMLWTVYCVYPCNTMYCIPYTTLYTIYLTYVNVTLHTLLYPV